MEQLQTLWLDQLAITSAKLTQTDNGNFDTEHTEMHYIKCIFDLAVTSVQYEILDKRLLDVGAGK